ncbi:3'-5' exonuclease [Dellaglioa sp. BT-FLS60]
MNFVTMDFETANNQRHSACSIALTIVRNNQIVDEFYSLIKPETPFNWRNIQIHGIHEEDVEFAPKFPELWSHISTLFQNNRLIVAHNAPFDNSVLHHTLAYYGLETPNFLLLDTVKTSRKLFPDFPNHKLNTVCDELDITLTNHHNALDDSVACANILLYQENNFGQDSLKPFVKPA